MNEDGQIIKQKYKYSDLTGEIIACALKVHTELGNGFQEVIYQRCLAIELDAVKIPFQREVEVPIHYKGQDVGTRRADIIVNNVILVEIKAIGELNASHFAQTINYLEAFNLEIGLLINFGEKSLRVRRFINKKID